VPFVVLLIVLSKALVLAHKVGDPLAAHLPPEAVFGLHTPLLLAAAVLVLVSFLAGVFARTALAAKMIRRLEDTLLSKVPGYALLKSTGASMLGVEGPAAYPVVYVRFDDSTQLGLRMDELENGLVTVFIPGTPDAQSGTVHYLAPARVTPANVKLAAAMQCLKGYGAGSRALLRNPCPAEWPPK
jgi:uncharacterized membrane protein